MSILITLTVHRPQASPTTKDVSYTDPSKEPIEPKTDELQALIYTLVAGTSSNLIGVGVFTHLYDLGDRRVRKGPAPDLDNLDLAIKPVRREGESHSHLGDYPRVIKCLAKENLFVDLKYAPHGHVESCLKSHCDTSEECRIRFAQEVIEAAVFIDSRGIIHSDLAACQFLLNDTLHVD
ncbi:uncharacterized protein BP5553_03896 [Venustampulla echinocandica]|uniref:Protein kinase domain-containing protein n=1 Tax=Venustampulla echinocandica TaxID=2656787 RepID=A0A370TVK2_9HELO|nr:uncharacterized protein BP5553_03896 [Venustampulla echinocandica]RDL39556.1 hypothetical protein BP5553_03896 [Venustampulla echinocandica]